MCSLQSHTCFVGPDFLCFTTFTPISHCLGFVCHGSFLPPPPRSPTAHPDHSPSFPDIVIQEQRRSREGPTWRFTRTTPAPPLGGFPVPLAFSAGVPLPGLSLAALAAGVGPAGDAWTGTVPTGVALTRYTRVGDDVVSGDMVDEDLPDDDLESDARAAGARPGDARGGGVLAGEAF